MSQFERLMPHVRRLSVINLPERSDRRKEMKAQFRKLGLQGNEPQIQIFPAVKPETFEGWPTAGTKGCFYSHLGVVESAIADQSGPVLILEDDCDFHDRAADVLPVLLGELATMDWDIAYIGHQIEPAAAHSGMWFETQEPILLAHSYLVNTRCLPRLRDFLHEVLSRPAGHPDGGPMHYDGALNIFKAQNPDVVVKLATDSLTFQRRSRSDISTGKWDQIPVTRELLSLARKVRYMVTGR